jgi:hypothetical protein
MPTTVEMVRTFLGLTPARPVDDAALVTAVAAANDIVAAFRPDLPSSDPETPDVPPVWPPRADYAATVQAAQLYGGRTATQGLAAYQDVGVSILPQIHPTVKELLQLGANQDSVVA